MSLSSSTVSITQYNVQGNLNSQIINTVTDGLTRNTISDIDQQVVDQAVGWTSFDKPFQPDFNGSSFVYGNYFVFSLRIDKKNISAKVLKSITPLKPPKECPKAGVIIYPKLKKMVKDHVQSALILRIPATPNIYDVVWNFEASSLWFFSNLKAANEELETLFAKSFRLSLIRIFPYTAADLLSHLSDSQRDTLKQVSPTQFVK